MKELQPLLFVIFGSFDNIFNIHLNHENSLKRPLVNFLTNNAAHTQWYIGLLDIIFYLHIFFFNDICTTWSLFPSVPLPPAG